MLKSMGGNFPGGSLMVGNFTGGSFPDTESDNRSSHRFWILKCIYQNCTTSTLFHYRPISKEYQINSVHQAIAQFELKLISIRRAKLYYIATLQFPRGVFKIIALALKFQKWHENSELKGTLMKIWKSPFMFVFI